MGVVKVNLRRSVDDDDYYSKSSFTSEGDELKQKELRHGNESDDDFDSSESAEAASELVVLGDQMFNVPYNLYDLPDLKGVLSLEAWNRCLSEDERVSLSAYLPDMDQQTFSLTMNEVLKGENIFFGSPLDCFFQRLKGGLCALEVSCFHEGLQILEKRKHFHFLSSYHDNMVRLFTDMKGTWSSCQPSVGVEERIHIWNKRNDSKPVFAVDLNALPAEVELFTKVGKDEDTIQSLKKTRYMDSNDDLPHVFPASVSTTALAAPITKPRGVLKIKSLESNSTRTSVVQASPCNSWGTRRTPKGVLKVKPKSVALHSQEKPRPSPIQPELLYKPSRLHASRFSHGLQQTSKCDVDFYDDDSHFPLPEVRGQNSRSSEFPIHINNAHRGELLTQNNGLMELKEKIPPWKTSRKAGVGSHNVEGHRQKPHNIGVRRRELSSGATETNTLVPGRCQGRRHITPLTSAAVSRTSSNINDEHEPFPFSNIESRHEDISGISSIKPHEADISGIPRDGRVFPITYKRKKGSSKHNPSDSLKHKIAEGHFESRVSERADYPPTGKAKPVKVKLKLWKK